MEPNNEQTSHPLQLPFTLRHDLRAGDLGSVLSLHGREFLLEHGFGLRFEGYVAEGLGRFALRYDPNFDRMWIAEDAAGNALGTVTVARASETEAQLRWFIVDAKARGKGIGKALLREAIAFAHERHYVSLFLWTLDDLNAALHLYRAEGFTLTEEKPNSEWANRAMMEQCYDLQL
jgi:GNAT superfamily N-acetyltransferase